MNLGCSPNPPKYLMHRFHDSNCTVGQLPARYNKLLRMVRGARSAHLNMERSRRSASRHTIVLGSKVSSMSLKHAYTTQPNSKVDTAKVWTSYTRILQLCAPRYRVLEHTPANALRAAMMRAFSRWVGVAPLARN